ncbi:ABC transporter permease [Paraburkholderia rhizosphaerae]|uniref:Nucleoside ABC transporter membrane protein n=1 Tax=Paraburkholderia rhizosphaerae TaxID=480658 RepID=A0A4R8LGL8_9BURK|nr:ABC transporter permease [Paraburkholderia rhizosphaerae]TDY42281.1 nucleoside ABC transporter membrane protein [Paraburkholderia rhizosphaerae]
MTQPLTAGVFQHRRDRFMPLRQSAEMLTISALAVCGAAVLFSLLLLALGTSPLEFFELLWRGGFGTAFSLQNALVRAAPLVFTALTVAIPAQLGLVVIGGEGALVLGGFAAACAALPFNGGGPPALVMLAMVAAALASGAAWIGLVGALRHFRGANETISSLLMSYLAIAIMNFFVEGPLRDPASSIKSSTRPIGDANMVGNIPGTSVHWGLAASIALALVAWLLMRRTTFGFAARLTGGNLRAARAQGLPVGRLIVTACALAGACAGLAGYFEVAAVQGRANASLAAGYGFSGILVSFLARHNALAIVPVAILVGGISAAGGLIQRRLDLPDATVLLLQGTLFVVLLVSETLYGRFAIFRAPRSEPGIEGN